MPRTPENPRSTGKEETRAYEENTREPRTRMANYSKIRGPIFSRLEKEVLVHGILSGSAHLTGMGAPHIGSYRIFSQSMNNASERSPLWTHRLPLSWPSSTAIRLLHWLPPRLANSPLSLSSVCSLLSHVHNTLWPVAFRNLFVIKAAIYFTLIEEIGRLPLATTIYHVLWLFSSTSFTLHRASRRLYGRRCIHEYVHIIARSYRDFSSIRCIRVSSLPLLRVRGLHIHAQPVLLLVALSCAIICQTSL